MSLPSFYLDTSVIGGYFDSEFEEDTRVFFRLFEDGKAIALTSELTTEELLGAPLRVRNLLSRLPANCRINILLNEEARSLQRAYMDAGIVPPGSVSDALHVAVATVYGASAIVSWNFKHIVRYDRIKGFHRVNAEYGYTLIEILSPKEVTYLG